MIGMWASSIIRVNSLPLSEPDEQTVQVDLIFIYPFLDLCALFLVLPSLDSEIYMLPSLDEPSCLLCYLAYSILFFVCSACTLFFFLPLIIN